MVHLLMKIIFVSVAVTIVDKIEETEAIRSDEDAPLWRETNDFTETEDSFLDRNSETFTALQDIEKKLNSELKSLLEEAETCRKYYPNLSDLSFGLKLYRYLLNELAGTPNKTTIFLCSINKRLVDNVRERIHQLEDFQKNFVANPKNSSTKSPGQGAQQRNLQKETRSQYSQGFKRGDDNDFNLKLEDEWKAKVPYMSHIYLGTSLFPILTEESRVLESATTARPPEHPRNVGTFRRDTGTVAKVYQLLTPMRWSKNTSLLSRGIRGLVSTVQESNRMPADDFRSDNEVYILPEERNFLSEPVIHKNVTESAADIQPVFLKDKSTFQKALHFLSSLGNRIRSGFNKLFKTKQ